VIRLVIDQKKDQIMFPNIHQRQPFNHISLSSSSNNNNNKKKKDDNKNSQQSLCVLIPQALYLWIKNKNKQASWLSIATLQDMSDVPW